MTNKHRLKIDDESIEKKRKSTLQYTIDSIAIA
jgi:hypothetical protein